jgi:hypothetical protein
MGEEMYILYYFYLLNIDIAIFGQYRINIVSKCKSDVDPSQKSYVNKRDKLHLLSLYNL